MKNPKEFLGRGWGFPFQFDSATGGVGYSEFEENIRQNITIILGTKPGERQMLPQFGCRIHELLFAPNTRATSAMVAHHVSEALRRWHRPSGPRCASPTGDQVGTVRVSVDYKILATNQLQQLSYNVSSR